MLPQFAARSTPDQLVNHRESTLRQYELAKRAKELGWAKSQIVILDGDLGKTGQFTSERNDFKRLMADIGLQAVGAVFAFEASRLSRAQSDWCKLVEVCAFTDTLIIDHEGIYDPNDFNDRIILGFKGTWSHTELHANRVRMLGARNNKAQRGELRIEIPTGYVYDHDDKIILDPDESVVFTVSLFFEKFRELRSTYKVAKYFIDNQIKFPFRRRLAKGAAGPLTWSSLSTHRISRILHNPFYTGTYVFGKGKSKPIVRDGNIVGRKFIKVRPRDEWDIVINDHHPAYISWEEYLENEKTLRSNDTRVNTVGRNSPPRNGYALVQGLVICL